MTAQLEKLVIKGLHSRLDLEVPFGGDISVFMGPNGIGKSTMLAILVHFLTGQWDRLAKQPFTSATLHFEDAASVTVFHDDCAEYNSGELTPKVLDVAEKLAQVDALDAFLEGRNLDDEESVRIEVATDLQSRDLRVFRTSVANYGPALKAASTLWKAKQLIDGHFPYRILYLPTYRRIEQDLTEVLAMSSMTMRRVRNEIELNLLSGGSAQTELVKFGMEDIERLIRGYVADIKEYSRQQVNSLSTSYLTVALRTRQSFDKEFFGKLSDKRITDILSRVDDEQLNASQRRGITEVIKGLRQRVSGGQLTRGQESISGYFPLLAETHDRISSRERPLQQLASVINRYIGPSKVASYDSTKYEFVISIDGDPIPLGGLSSGEKQIVSLFATLALTNEHNLLVIVDEPELSLSVLWQESLLIDIISLPSCRGLVAVTHSPFIYGEKLLSETKDLGDYSKRVLVNG